VRPHPVVEVVGIDVGSHPHRARLWHSPFRALVGVHTCESTADGQSILVHQAVHELVPSAASHEQEHAWDARVATANLQVTRWKATTDLEVAGSSPAERGSMTPGQIAVDPLSFYRLIFGHGLGHKRL
jgi:hypothetical protein